ncbi:MAG: hypothetical protein WAZ19_02270 [Anaerolineae bacterium]
MSEIIKTQNGLVVPTALKEMQATLKSFIPKTKNDAIRMLAFLSITNHEATAKRLKESCTNFLLNRCAECENAIDVESGAEVTKVERNTNVYNDSPEVDEISAQIEELKVRLKEAQEAAGISHTKTSTYYRVKI